MDKKQITYENQPLQNEVGTNNTLKNSISLLKNLKRERGIP